MLPSCLQNVASPQQVLSVDSNLTVTSYQLTQVKGNKPIWRGLRGLLICSNSLCQVGEREGMQAEYSC